MMTHEDKVDMYEVAIQHLYNLIDLLSAAQYEHLEEIRRQDEKPLSAYPAYLSALAADTSGTS